MKTSDSDLKVNRNIYSDGVTCDRMRLIGPKPINIVYLKSPNETANSFCLRITEFTQNSRCKPWVYIQGAYNRKDNYVSLQRGTYIRRAYT